MEPVTHDQSGKTDCFGTLSHSPSSLNDRSSPMPNWVDLSFLTDKEKASILKVIKADLELKRTTLGDAKRDIEKRKQFQKCNEDPRGTCACCGEVFSTLCDRNCAAQCQQCRYLMCKLCKREQGGSVSCVLCIKERLYDLQCIGYLPLFQVVSGDSEVKSSGSYPLHGSDLLKLSLGATKRQVTFSLQESDMQLGNNRRPSSLAESKILEQQKGNNNTTKGHINDPNSGFKIIKQATSEEDMIDLCSLYSEPCEPEDYDIHGEIKFGVWYKTEENTLYVRVVKAKDLSAANKDGTSDPYVKTYLLPGMGKLSKKRTGIQRSTTKPEFNELLKYGSIGRDVVKAKTLWVSVWDWDRFGRNQFLGEVRLPLSSLDLTDSTDKWYTLQDMDEKDQVIPFGTKGMLLLSLMFEPSDGDNSEDEKETQGKLKVQIKQAEDLRPDDLNAQINPFARCYLLPNQLVDCKKKTGVVINTLNPVWNSEIEFRHVSLEDLESSRALEVTIWDRDRRGVNEFIGGIRLGPDPLACSDSTEWMDSIEDEVTHWEAALARPGEWVEQWHNLRPSMSSLNQNAKKERHRPTPSTYGQEIATSVTSLSSSTDSEAEIPVTNSDSRTHMCSDTLKSLAMKRPPRGNYIIRGEILVTVEYKDEILLVHIDRAVKIAAANKNGTSDSYVKTYLLPDRTKASKRKTEVQKRTVDPVYNTTLKYEENSDQQHDRVIWLTIWNSNKFGSNLFLGEACISMSTFVTNLNQSFKMFYSCKLVDFSITGVVMSESSDYEQNEQKNAPLRDNSEEASHPEFGLEQEMNEIETMAENPSNLQEGILQTDPNTVSEQSDGDGPEDQDVLQAMPPP